MPPRLCLDRLVLGVLRAHGGPLRPYLDRLVLGASKVQQVMTATMATTGPGVQQERQVMTGTTRPCLVRLVLGASKAHRATMGMTALGDRQAHGVPPRLWLDRLVLGVLRAVMATMAHEDRQAFGVQPRLYRVPEVQQAMMGTTALGGPLRPYRVPEGHRESRGTMGIRVRRGSMVRQVLAVSRPRWPQIRAIKTPPTQRGAR